MTGVPENSCPEKICKIRSKISVIASCFSRVSSLGLGLQCYSKRTLFQGLSCEFYETFEKKLAFIEKDCNADILEKASVIFR